MTTISKYDIFVKDFLIINKFVSFERIGELVLEAGTPGADDHSPVIAGNLIFNYNKKAGTTGELITFIAEKLQRSKSLIESDIYSYLEQARELMNTGKYWELPGVGTFSTNMSGEYQFSVAVYKPDDNKAGRKEKPQKNADRHRNTRSGQGIVKVLTFFIVTALIAGLIWVAYEYFLKDKFADWATDKNMQPIADTSSRQNANPNTAAGSLTVAAGDSIPIDFIFETTSLLSRAEGRVAKLKSYGYNAGYDSLKNDTGQIYNIYIRKKAITADTTGIKDSLSKVFKKPILVNIPKQ